MSRRRIVLLLLAAGLITAASISAVIAFYPGRISDPETADRDTLLRWIVTRDLSREDPALRRSLALRLEQEFGQCTIDVQAADQHLKASQKERLWSNVCALIGPWFDEKVEEYFALAGNQRTAYLDRTIDAVGKWRSVQSICNGESTSDVPASNRLTLILQQIDQWKQQAEPERRKQIDEFMTALQARWLWRTFLGSIGRPPAGA